MNVFTSLQHTTTIKGGNTMKKKLLTAIFGAVLVLGACGGGDKTKEDATEPNTGTETAVVDAEKIVNAKCITCHGGNLEGASGPALDEIGSELSEAEILDVINNGQGGMPGGIIKGEDADAVAKWLVEKK